MTAMKGRKWKDGFLISSGISRTINHLVMKNQNNNYDINALSINPIAYHFIKQDTNISLSYYFNKNLYSSIQTLVTLNQIIINIVLDY